MLLIYILKKVSIYLNNVNLDLESQEEQKEFRQFKEDDFSMKMNKIDQESISSNYKENAQTKQVKEKLSKFNNKVIPNPQINPNPYTYQNINRRVNLFEDLDEDFEGGEKEKEIQTTIPTTKPPTLLSQIFILPLLSDFKPTISGKLYHPLTTLKHLLLGLSITCISEAYIQTLSLLTLCLSSLAYTLLAQPFRCPKAQLLHFLSELAVLSACILSTKLFDPPQGFGASLTSDYSRLGVALVCLTAIGPGLVLLANTVADFYYWRKKKGTDFK